jgi:hypothetical protein
VNTTTLKIPGHCPSKKNHYRTTFRDKRGRPLPYARLTKDDMVKTYEYKAVLLLRSQWGGPPLAERVRVHIYVDYFRNEPDDVGVAETVYDALQAAGVVAHDRLLCLWGEPAIYRHKVAGRADEGVAITLRWGEPAAAPQ